MRRLLLPYLLLLTGVALAQQPAPRPHAPTAQHAPTAKELAYYCASGNVVKYHSSPTCRGLNRCSASVQPLALSEAQSKMDPCKLCH